MRTGLRQDEKRFALDSGGGKFARLGHQLLTPDKREYTPDYNTSEFDPQYVKELVFVVKRYYKPE